MPALLPRLVAVAVVGAGLVTGLLFAFANFALRALRQLPDRAGMEAMQRINREIQNPLFFALFFGTALCCAAVVVLVLLGERQPGSGWWLGGALAYLLGPFGITAVRNVPLNERLDRADLADAAAAWPDYAERWQRWNHLRTALGAAAMSLLAWGLAVA